MKLTTKSLLSSLVAATVNAAPSAYRLVSQRSERRYERILEKHDRKGELRASILGMTAVEFREQERHRSLNEIVRAHGFADERAFYRAVMAKIRQELKQRGWSVQRIERFESMKLHRIG